ncbi:MAG: metal-sensing transcriptional repressor [bacterium]
MCDTENTHPQAKKVINRLSRIIGHTNAVKEMYEDGRDCSEVLIQIAAIKSALTNVGKIILDDHIDHCVVEAVDNNNDEVLEDLKDAIEKFLK